MWVTKLYVGAAEAWDDFAQLRTTFQWFQPPIHPTFMQRPMSKLETKITVHC
ncbi:hypothetical protein LC608_15685 [Nostoc sp. XA010]|uniref:hypothetical protein n=1 Tax=Nostoc sp. XA010 TaxID=2780407 RepID=UPI001E3308D6|nr:hypothetical protein [Nostoc sp. XA010]MCC5658405.1 hypothetical protein [Nostoc sp. XA010]